MQDKISLAGDLGSGKSTVSDILVPALGARYYSTGSIVRKIAAERGMTIAELNVYMETHPEIDHEVDAGIAALSEVDELLIIDSRMAWHFTKGTFKVYLSTDIETSAIRIMTAKREGERSATLEEAIEQTRARRESEKKRYSEQYGVDIKDLTNYSLVVDTTYATPSEVAAAITEGFERWKSDKTLKRALISPERLNYPDDEPDAELLSEYSELAELGGELPPVEIAERDGEFYVVRGLEAALAASLSMSTFVSAVIVGAGVPDKQYVKMKNSL
jgi:cytidylate kinase